MILFKSDNDRCCLWEREDGTFQVVAYEVTENEEIDVFYLVRFRTIEGVFGAIEQKGVKLSDKIDITTKEIEYLLETCVCTGCKM